MTRKAFKKIFDQYYEPIRNFLYFKLKDIDKAEDLTQDVFLKAWEKRNGIENETVKGYLFTIATNLMRKEFNIQAADKKVELKITDKTTSETPGFEMESKEFAEQLKIAIEDLPEKSQTVFLMSRMDKHTYPEIAKILEISVKTVEKRMSLALAELREKLKIKI